MMVVVVGGGEGIMAPCCDLLRMGGMDKKNKNLYSS